jgi:hypothetical protein
MSFIEYENLNRNQAENAKKMAVTCRNSVFTIFPSVQTLDCGVQYWDPRSATYRFWTYPLPITCLYYIFFFLFFIFFWPVGLYYSMLHWAYSNTNTESWLILVVHNNLSWIKGLFFPHVPLLYSARWWVIIPLKVRDKPWKSKFESTNRLMH